MSPGGAVAAGKTCQCYTFGRMNDVFSLERPDGVSVHVARWQPAGAVRGVVQIAHGMAEHGARYDRFATSLVNAGFAVYADDHRGHGRTARSEDLGHFADENGWSKVIEDLHAVRARAKEEHPEVPVFYFGHSMGSFLGQHLLAHHPSEYKSFVFTGTDHPGGFLVNAGKQVAKLERLRLGGRGKSQLLQKLSFGAFNGEFKPVRTEFDWLSRDGAEVDKYIADPLCGFDVTTQLWVDLLGALDAIDRHGFAAAAPATPVWLAAGSRDPVAKKGAGTRLFAERLHKDGLLRVRCTIYPDARHELLNETNHEAIANDIIAFIREQCA